MTHGNPTPAKMITAYCEECRDQKECYDLGNMKVCENCLMTIGKGKTEEKKAELQGVLF